MLGLGTLGSTLGKAAKFIFHAQVAKQLGHSPPESNVVTMLEQKALAPDASIVEKATIVLEHLKDLFPDTVRTLVATSSPDTASTGASALGFKWSYFNNSCLVSVAIVGGVWAFKFLWKQKPPLDVGLDPLMLQDAKNVAEEVLGQSPFRLPSLLVDKKLALLKNEGELVNLTFDLNRDLLIKKIHVMDSSFAIAANSASSLISPESIALFCTLAILGLIIYKIRKPLMDKVRKVIINFLADNDK
jgi:hypothetical protein